MSRTARFVVFGVGALGVGILGVVALLGLPAFGHSSHPYRTASIPAAIAHGTSNAISSVNFDQRGLDTLGEETIFLASVLVIAVVLRPADDENERRPLGSGHPLDSTVFGGIVFFAVIGILGLDVVAHGHLTPGGGFQGGVILGTGIHLIYVAGTYAALRRIRPVRPFEWTEAIGAAAFACVGVCGVLLGVSFLANVIPQGALGTLFSAGTVPVLNGVVGVEVASGVVVLLSKFFEQAFTVQPSGPSTRSRRPGKAER